MKKCLYLLLALLALGQTAWAQTQQINVGNEQQLRTYLESNTEYTIVVGQDIVLSSGNIDVNYGKTLNMNGHTISVHPEVGVATRLFNVQTGAQFTISGTGNLSGHTNTSDGGLIYLNQNATLTLSGATLNLNINGSVDNGGAIYNNGGTVNLLSATLTAICANGVNVTNGGIIYNAGTLNMNSGTTTLSGGHATNGGALYVNSGNFTAGGETTFSNNTATNGGALYVNGGIASCSADFSNNTATNGGAIYNAGTLNLDGGNIGGIDETDPDNPVSHSNTAINNGGAIFNAGGTLNINGGSISSNNTTATAGDGGGIHSHGGTINMTGGSIGNNTAARNCGGVNLTNSTTMTMSGGNIANNTANNNDGGVYVGDGSTLTMTGGSITGNTAARADRGGGISVVGTLKMSGSPIVMGNLANGNNSNVLLPSNKKITVDDAFTTSATVGVTCAGGVNTVFTSGFVAHSPGTSTVFTSDDDNLAVGISGGEAKLNTYIPGVPPGSIPYLNVDATGEHGTAYCSTYTKMSTISDDNPTLSNGWYVVDKNLTFNTRIRISGTVHLLLMDNTLLKANKGIFVPSGNALHIWAQSYKTTDPNDLTGRITAMANDKNCSGIGGYGSYNSDAGYLYFHGGIIFANGGDGASGISGEKSWGTDYSINFFGGFVTGGGGKGGAGIGGFQLGSCSSVLVTGGTVVGIGGTMAAGIGTGYGGKIYSKMVGGMSGNPDDATDVSIVRITGGLVTVWGTSGAGIGGGEAKDTYDGTPLTVYIEGGTVVAYTLSADAQAIGRGANALDRFDNYLNIYDGAKVLASTSINGDVTLQTAGAGRSNYRDYKQIEIRPCDHPEHNNPISYTNNTEDGNLSVNCPYCYTKEPYTFQTTGNWNTASNWLGSIMPGAGKDVAVKAAATIPASCTANVGNIDMQEGGSLTIADGGQLIHSNAVMATVKKDIQGYETAVGGWNFIATPIAAGTTPSINNGLLDISGNSDYDLYYYDEPNHYWRNHKQHDIQILNNGQGYLYAHSNAVELTFDGTLRAGSSDGTYTVDGLSHSAEKLTGFNLVGNPFACNATIDRPAYVVNGKSIQAYEGTQKVLEPCEGVMVQADSEHESVTFTKVIPGAQTTQAHPGNIQIVLAEAANTRGAATALDNAIVSFNEGSQLGKFYFGEQSANIYLPQDGEAYAIAYSDKQGEMPLNFKAKADGQYTLTVNPEGVELGYLHLIDNMTGADIDLLPLLREQGGLTQPATYTFTAKTTDYESRFRLVFATISEDADGDSETFAFISDGNLIVSGTGTLQVIDMLGHQLLSRDIHSAFRIPHSSFPAGVYVLRLIDGNDVRTQKIVVR